VKNEYYNPGEAPERSVDVEIAIRLKEKIKHLRWRNMSIVTHIAGERTSQFYTFRLLVYKNH
jgi:hypothetical protein